MMTLSQAETEIYKKIGQFTGVEKANLRIENQPLNNGQPFKAPADKPWCKVFVQYADSQVVAIGNALGQYQNTVSSGIISGKGRPITAGGEGGDSGESLTDLLQTDAAINPGNSGGPLLNYSGQVIGINTAVASNAEGIGFAIPVNATKGTLKGVLAGKGVQRSYLGLRYVEITAAVAKQYDLPVKKGAYVAADKGGSAVVADSPADKAGLKEKDIITKINDEEVGVSGGVATLVGEYAPGDTVEVTYLRDGAEKRVKVTLAAYLAD